MNTAYTITLFFHSWNRWLILIAGITVIAAAIKGVSAKSAYSPFQRKWSVIFLSSLHLQLLVGLLLYFVLSPITTEAFHNFGAAMKNPVLRFFAVEHSFTNFIAIALMQVGSIMVKRTDVDAVKHRRTLIWSGLAMVLILSMIPMGMMGVSRPWFRF
jgi:hypothetical protein